MRIVASGVGGITESARNFISGNIGSGVALWGDLSTGNTIQGNYIGTDVTGTVALGNAGAGVLIDQGSAMNRIGSEGDGVADVNERNVISANSGSGVRISGPGSDDNVVAGNYIGTDLTGTQALVRLMLMQKARDRAEGRNTAGYVTGYRGSPLGAVRGRLAKA